MTSSDREYYTDTDIKNVSKESSLDSVKLEANDNTHDQANFERRTMRWVDIRILPLLALLYSFCLIDRINTGAAFTAGMGVDLGLLHGERLNIVTCLYFVPYILLQLPSNIALRVVGVRVWLTFSVIAWGAVQLGMGFVKSWHGLTATRVLLGALEAPFFPAMVFIISTWYKRHEVQKRMAVFFLISVTMSGVSPILAWGLSKLNGKHGIRGWRWIFIIEGAITIFLGIVTWFLIPDFPHKNQFLTKEQTQVVLKRIEEDRGDSCPDPLDSAKIRKHLKDWTIWAYGIMFFCTTMPAFALSYFISIILRGFGWSATKSLLLSAPPYGPPILTVMITSWLSDKYKHRTGFIVFNAILCIVGLVLTAFGGSSQVRYFGVFLTNIGNFGTIPGVLAYSSNNVVSHNKRTVQTAITVSFGGLGGIVATNVFRTKDAPHYTQGLAVVMGSQGLLIAIVLITSLYFYRKNKLSREGKLAEPLEGQPGFFYTL